MLTEVTQYTHTLTKATSDQKDFHIHKNSMDERAPCARLVSIQNENKLESADNAGSETLSRGSELLEASHRT